MGDETITTTILAGICVNIFYLRCKNNACDFFIQYLVDIFEYIRCSITQYSADLHKKLIEMSVKCLLRDF